MFWVYNNVVVYIYVYIYIFSDSLHYRLLQTLEYSSLCYTSPYYLFILYIVVVVVVLVAQSCLTLCDAMDYSPPGSSVHGILQAKIVEWVAIPFSGGSSWPRD